MYAIVDIAGKQFKVEKDQRLYVHRLPEDEGKSVKFDNVMLVDNGGKVSSSISSKTSYIVAGDNMGPSKKDKAEKLNIELITEQDFLNSLE